ncbi:hypothetical protein [Paenibacillus gallinarum]|uniref:Uncharacterized protein n=1 Tax=Paenibacillus gallinarum TaxID=2762232 RepID=A0ABR8T3B6_9BACL|nr:hypothetical protein [Paenibacillus gallinarum]MBD7970247.1 hypothetical protein [Paenibacillus gallinarum]
MRKRFEFDFEGEKISGTDWAKPSNGLFQAHPKTIIFDEHVANRIISYQSLDEDLEIYDDYLKRLADAFNQTKLFDYQFNNNVLDYFMLTHDHHLLVSPEEEDAVRCM